MARARARWPDHAQGLEAEVRGRTPATERTIEARADGRPLSHARTHPPLRIRRSDTRRSVAAPPTRTPASFASRLARLGRLPPSFRARHPTRTQASEPAELGPAVVTEACQRRASVLLKRCLMNECSEDCPCRPQPIDVARRRCIHGTRAIFW
ncbi:hypothetical protein C8Q79DRAFT_956780 [Trametes meyenii]|nr:hypothetical protein C8Q79DRAFT_956780 [Trametes meyenii]